MVINLRHISNIRVQRNIIRFFYNYMNFPLLGKHRYLSEYKVTVAICTYIFRVTKLEAGGNHFNKKKRFADLKLYLLVIYPSRKAVPFAPIRVISAVCCCWPVYLYNCIKTAVPSLALRQISRRKCLLHG